jgi:phage portal protein BeeE
MIKINLKRNPGNLIDESAVDCYTLVMGRQYIDFKSDDVVHIKYPNPNYGQNGEHLYGQSPLQAALPNMQSSNEALRQNIKSMKSGGAYGIIHGKNMPLDPNQAKELKDRMKEMDADPSTLANIAGSSVDIGFTRLSLTSDQLKPFDQLSFDEKQICNVLSWDDKLLNASDGAKYDNVLQARKRVITDNIMPDCKMFETAFKKYILPKFKSYESTCLVFDFSELPEMQDNVKELSEWLAMAVDRGVITRNEYRIAIGYQPLTDMGTDVLTTMSDVYTLEDAVSNDFALLPRNPLENG